MVAAVITTPKSDASCSRRAAICTVLPIASYCSDTSVEQRSNDDLAGVDANANGRRVFDLSDVLDHGKRRATCPDRVILLRDRRAEQRHDAVALQLVHRSFKPGDGFAHRRRDDPEPMVGFLRVEMIDEGGRSGDIGNKHRQALSLSLAGRARAIEFRWPGSRRWSPRCPSAGVDPQASQILVFGELRCPHSAHSCTSMEPQFAQNFASSSLWCWQVSQRIAAEYATRSFITTD